MAFAAGFIVYGSLYPFTLRAPSAGGMVLALPPPPWAMPPGGRGDILANLLLYVPFGLLTALALPARLPAGLRLAVAGLSGAALSLGIEVAQLSIAGRTSSSWDVLCNTLGMLAGAVLALVGGARGLDRRRLVAEPVAALLVLAWLAYRFYPYVPALDLQAWRDNLKPLLLDPTLDLVRALRLAVSWTAVVLLIEAATGDRRHGPPLALLGLAGALAAEIVIPGKRLTLDETAGIALALPAWALFRGRRWTAPVMAALLMGVVLAERLEPFAFQPFPLRPFGWVPFGSLIGGSLEAGMQAVLQKLFLYGALLWWLVRAGLPLPVAVVGETVLVLAASMAQLFLVDRSAEVTDALLVVSLGLAWRLLPDPAAVTERPGAATGWRQRVMRPRRGVAADHRASHERRGRHG